MTKKMKKTFPSLLNRPQVPLCRDPVAAVIYHRKHRSLR